ncbi:MAG: preprotein translocase subunit SecE [Chloroflexota bacterium]|nr:preprotein translocase subunit SecE [Chloroflexota bacterium]
MAARSQAPAVRTGRNVGLVRFAQECWSELQKVTWPDRQTVIRLTVLVIIISAIVGAYILGADQVFTYLVNGVLLNQSIPTPAPAAP